MQVRSLGQEDPWRWKWLPTPVFLPGEAQGQRSLVGYSPWSHKKSGTTGVTQHTCRMQGHFFKSVLHPGVFV